MTLPITNGDIRKWRIYARISKTEPEDALVFKQVQVLEKFADNNGLNLTEPVYDDNGFSGREEGNRPGYQWMLKDIIEHGDVFGILVTRLDRLNRNLHNALHFMEICKKPERQIPIYAVFQPCDIYTANGKFAYQIYSLLAEKESDDISERTKLALKSRKIEG